VQYGVTASAANGDLIIESAIPYRHFAAKPVAGRREAATAGWLTVATMACRMNSEKWVFRAWHSAPPCQKRWTDAETLDQRILPFGFV
jgi:hypothetical protein